MILSTQRAGQVVAGALIVTVITQIVYLLLEASGNSSIAYPIWRTEALAALVVSVLGFALVGRNPLVGGALAAAGIFNLFQVGMGLTLFYQLGYGGVEAPNAVFMPVLGFSFFLYFAAKAAIGFAGIVLGAGLWRGESGLWRWIGLAALLSGFAALLANGAAMSLGMALVFGAGAAGTAATFFAALALLRSLRDEA